MLESENISTTSRRGFISSSLAAVTAAVYGNPFQALAGALRTSESLPELSPWLGYPDLYVLDDLQNSLKHCLGEGQVLTVSEVHNFNSSIFVEAGNLWGNGQAKLPSVDEARILAKKLRNPAIVERLVEDPEVLKLWKKAACIDSARDCIQAMRDDFAGLAADVVNYADNFERQIATTLTQAEEALAFSGKLNQARPALDILKRLQNRDLQGIFVDPLFELQYEYYLQRSQWAVDYALGFGNDPEVLKMEASLIEKERALNERGVEIPSRTQEMRECLFADLSALRGDFSRVWNSEGCFDGVSDQRLLELSRLLSQASEQGIDVAQFF